MNTVVVRIPEEIRDQAKVIAGMQGWSWQDVVRDAVDLYMAGLTKGAG